MRHYTTALALGVTLAFGISARAHHSQTMFEPEKQVTVEGTVSRWVWSNPHTWLYVDVKKADGSVDTWGFEANSAASMQRAGWKRTQFAAGDQVTVTGWPMKNGERKALLGRVMTADGTTKELNGNGPQIPR
jgi:Family of unknown function (DUF6152)